MLNENLKRLKKKLDGYKKYHHIHPSVLMGITWKNFTAKKLRSILTVMGVVIGVSAIFFLFSFGMGIQDLVTTQVIGDSSLKSIEVNSPNSKIISLDEGIVNDMRQFPHVEKVGTQFAYPGIATLNKGQIDVVVFGVDQNYQELSSLTLVKGRLLESSDTNSIVINRGTLESLGIKDESAAIGKTVEIAIPLEKYGAKQKQILKDFSIVGVIDSKSGSEVYIPSPLFEIAGLPNYSNVKIVADDIVYVNSVRRLIESKGFQTSSLTDTLDEINNIFGFFNVVIIGFGSIGMVVAILGMFNTLTISLLERTKEIGLMIALGGRRVDMFKLFTLEALTISFFGSIIGIVFAYLASRVVNTIVNVNAQSRGVDEWFELFSTPPWLIIVTILASLAVGFIVVYFPAKRAERINPIDALNRE